jgi:hypothetical protein
MGTPQRRRALDEFEAVGQEHADERTHGRVQETLHGRAVDLEPLRLAGREADAELVRAVAVAAADLDPRRGGVEAHDLALRRRAARAPGAAEVQALEQVGLARPVRPVHDGEPLAQRDVRARVGAEVAQAQASDEHQ